MKKSFPIILLVCVFAQFIFIGEARAALSQYVQPGPPDLGSVIGKAIGGGVQCMAGRYLKLELKDIIAEFTGTGKAVPKSIAVMGAAASAMVYAVPTTPAPSYEEFRSLTWEGTKEANAEKQKWQKGLDAFEECLKGSVIKSLMDYVVDVTVDWIQNGDLSNGGPRFDTGNFEKNMWDQGVASVLNNTMFEFLCSPFQAQVRLSFALQRKFSTRLSCTLDRITGNINGFMNNFNNGGWLAYNAMWSQPQNNYFGAVLMMNDQANAQAAEFRRRAESELNRGSGFLAMKICAVKTDPNTLDQDLCDGNGACGYVQDTNNNWCLPRNLQNATPGRVIGDAVQKSVVEKGLFGWEDSIGNSEDIGRWVGAVLEAVFNRLMKEGLAGLSTFNSRDSNRINSRSWSQPNSQQNQAAIIAAQSHNNDYANWVNNGNVSGAQVTAQSLVNTTANSIRDLKTSSRDFAQTILSNDQKINCYQTGFDTTNASCQSYTGKASSLKSTSPACITPTISANDISNAQTTLNNLNSAASDIKNLQNAANNFLAIPNPPGPTTSQIQQFSNATAQYITAYSSLTLNQSTAPSAAQTENTQLFNTASSTTAQLANCP